jgi:type IV pilus biogenesis protein CpaD/CtpE
MKRRIGLIATAITGLTLSLATLPAVADSTSKKEEESSLQRLRCLVAPSSSGCAQTAPATTPTTRSDSKTRAPP